MTTCPSGFVLDEHLTHGVGAPAVAAHVDRCRDCQDRLAARREDAARFVPLAAATWRGVAACAATPARPAWVRWPVLTPVGAAVALALLLLVRPAVVLDPPGYVGVKGAFTLTIAARRGGELFAADAAHPVRAGDELRFIPSGAGAERYIAIASVDGRGEVTLFYPASAAASSVPLPSPGDALPGGITLDGAPGPERLFVVITARPIAGAVVRAAAQAEVAGKGRVEEKLASSGARVYRVTLAKLPVAGSP